MMLTFKINLLNIKRKLYKYVMNNNYIRNICQINVFLKKQRNNIRKYGIIIFIFQSVMT